jgi:hypothetical protein
MSIYWEGSPEHWEAITKVQSLKRSITGVVGRSAIRSDQYVITNPVTGREVPLADLQYAANRRNMLRLYESGEIREDRWAFLWYHG